MTAAANVREWRKEIGGVAFLISTSLPLMDVDYINAAFGSEDMYWAKPLPRDELQLMLGNSITLGLFQILPSAPPSTTVSEPSSPRTPSPSLEDAQGEPEQERRQQIGLARLVTDLVTFIYLTDVYMSPEQRKHGLGSWLVACCGEIIDGIPALRRAFLVTGPSTGKAFYEKALGFWDVREEGDSLVAMTKKTYGRMPQH